MMDRINKIVSELKEVNEELKKEIENIPDITDGRRSDLITIYYDIDSAIKFLEGVYRC